MNGRDDLVDVIANNAETNVLRILFNDTTQGCLSLLGHHVGLVQDNELEAFRKQGASLCELLDLFTNNVDTTLIGGIELNKRWLWVHHQSKD